MRLPRNFADQVMRMINRLTSRKHELKEVTLMRITQALILSRITYGEPYLKLTKKDTEKLDIIIWEAYKLALGLLTYMSTKKRLSLGVHNTYIELAEVKTRN